MARAPGSGTDWASVLERLLRGDRVAFLELSRLVTSFLVRWRAYDFRDEWDDLIQEVILAAVEAARARRLRDPKAVVGYLRMAARYKFVDWLRRRRGESLDTEQSPARRDELGWPLDKEEGVAEQAERLELRDALARLPERERKVLIGVYLEGRTYEEASKATGIPLGSLKRYLRDGLVALRSQLAPSPAGVDPIPGVGPTSSDGGVRAGPGVAPAGDAR